MNIQKAIQDRLDKVERNKLWLVRKSGMDKTALYTFMKGKSELRLTSLEMLATKGFGIKLSTLIAEAEKES